MSQILFTLCGQNCTKIVTGTCLGQARSRAVFEVGAGNPRFCDTTTGSRDQISPTSHILASYHSRANPVTNGRLYAALTARPCRLYMQGLC